MNKIITRLLMIVVFALSAAAGLWFSIQQHKLANNQLPAPGSTATMRTFHSPTSFVAQIKNDPNAGEKIFMQFCAACHGQHASIDVNAPTIGNRRQWQGYQQLGTNKLVELASHGNGAMPARGG